MELEPYTRKTFDIEAVQITAENIWDVAKLINPNFRVHQLRDGEQYIWVPFMGRDGKLQKSQAFIGDWVTVIEDGNLKRHKRYTDKRFKDIFEPSQGD